jgi:hypothetical protein
MLMPVLLALALADAPTVQVRPGAGPGRVEVVAVLTGRLLEDVPSGALKQEQGERWLRFSLVDPETGKEGAAIFGAYCREKTLLVFVPRHALTAGQRYRATLDLGGGKKVAVEHQVVKENAAPPIVDRIYPTGDVLPANQLKFYLHFSKSMRETKDIFDQLQILDAQGKPVSDPWRRTELWSADGRRLTVLIHPGRIKRGVGPRVEEGPVLLPDRQYTLVIGAEVADASGQPLGKAFKKTFRTVAEKRTRPLPEKWTVRPSPHGTRQPLVVEFPDPLDRALLDRFLTVRDQRGQPVAGRIEVGKEERSWIFHPEQPWDDSYYTLTVDGDLEDLAGNTPVRLFDVDLQDAPPAPPKLSLRFRPRS